MILGCMLQKKLNNCCQQLAQVKPTHSSPSSHAWMGKHHAYEPKRKNNNKKELRRIQVHRSLKHSLHWGGNSFHLVSTSWLKNWQIFVRHGRKYWNKTSTDEGWDILVPLVYVSVIYLSFISFFSPPLFIVSSIFFIIKAILPIHVSSPALFLTCLWCCSPGALSVVGH